MSTKEELKKIIINRLHEIVDLKIKTARSAVESAKKSRNNDTKSSAGDKHETGRAMMQIELEKNELQLSKALVLKQELSQINIKKEFKKVEYGSLVITDHGKFFISIGIGKLELSKETFFVISLASPIGKLLQNKTAGEKVQFQEREITIKVII